ncbi:MAG: SpoIIE family protein phosphatase [Actinomycetota bacterium]
MDSLDEREASPDQEQDAGHVFALQSVTAALSAAVTPEAVAHAIVSEGKKALRARSGSLGIRDGSEIVLVAELGLDSNAASKWQRFDLAHPAPMSLVIQSGTPIFIESADDLLAAFPIFEDKRGLLASSSWASLPISVDGSVVGALVFSFEKETKFSSSDRTFLLALSQQCSQALERARLYEAQRRLRLQAEEDRERARFLADATKLLNESLQLEPTLEALVRCAVPRMADWCAIHLKSPNGSVGLAAIAHEDPTQVSLARKFVELYPPDPNVEGTAAYSAMRGTSHLIRELTDEAIQKVVRNPEQLELVRQLQIRSSMTVPLIVEGSSIGSLTMISSRKDRLFEEKDLSFAQDFASRAAIAIQHARIYESRAHIARTLQQSLLPPTLPSIPGVELAAVYRAAAEGHEVGGDFYDIFRTDKSSWAVVIGDVCGKDAEAAATTALARYTIRASAMQTRKPSRILAELNEAIIRQGTDRFITVIVSIVTIRPGSVRIVLASGGHPFPLISRSDGTIQALGKTGTLVGTLPTIKASDVSASLAQGESILYYTDGCTEARSPSGDIFGENRLMSVVRQADYAHPSELTARVDRSITEFADGSFNDDIALLALRVGSST